MVEEEYAWEQICRKPGFRASAPGDTALVTLGTVCCMQEICIPGEGAGEEADTVEAFSRCAQQPPPGPDHGLGPEVRLPHRL